MKTLLGVLISALLLNLVASLAHGASFAQSTPLCVLASEGIATSTWVQHRIMINGKAVYGSDNMSAVVDRLQEFRQKGLCR